MIDLLPVLDLAHLLKLVQVQNGVDLALVEVKACQFAPDALLGYQLGHGLPGLGGRLQVPMVGYAQDDLPHTLLRQFVQLWLGLRIGLG